MIDKLHAILASSLQEFAVIVNGIYFNVSQNSKFPYLYVGEFQANDSSLLYKKRQEISFKIILFFRDKRFKANYQIIKKIKEKLSLQEKISLELESEKIANLTDGITEQIILQYKALLED